MKLAVRVRKEELANEIPYFKIIPRLICLHYFENPDWLIFDYFPQGYKLKSMSRERYRIIYIEKNKSCKIHEYYIQHEFDLCTIYFIF